MDALGIKIEPTAGDATNSGIEQVKFLKSQGYSLILFTNNVEVKADLETKDNRLKLSRNGYLSRRLLRSAYFG